MKHSYVIATVLIAALLSASLIAAEPAADKADVLRKATELAAREAREAAGQPKLNCLTAKPEKPRFEITDKVWPAEYGQAHLCLWNDDRLAAFSFTIDDNGAPYHQWWIEQGNKYNFRATWFAISGRMTGGGFWGTPDHWKKLKELGHDVQSHTVTHLNYETPGWKGINWEYAESIREIKTCLPGHKVVALAYPGGKMTKMNSREIAAKYFIAARGTVGTLNTANQIDYFSINASGGIHVREDDKGIWGNIRNLLDKSRYRGRQYRGWAVHLAHGVKAKQREQLAPIFEFIKENRDKLWVGLFADVVRYGQQRDTATLKVTKTDDKEIRFTLTDRVDDALFDFPLTVKVRLADSWAAVTATQNGKPIEAKLVEHNGGRFTLVKAVPDRGEVTLRPSAGGTAGKAADQSGQ